MPSRFAEKSPTRSAWRMKSAPFKVDRIAILAILVKKIEDVHIPRIQKIFDGFSMFLHGFAMPLEIETI